MYVMNEQFKRERNIKTELKCVLISELMPFRYSIS